MTGLCVEFCWELMEPIEGFVLPFRYDWQKIYLAQEGLTLTNGSRDPMAMQFGDTELRRVHPNTGGFLSTQMRQVIRCCSIPAAGASLSELFSLQQVLTGDVNPAWIENAIVIIGVTAISAKDLINSASIASNNPGMVYGAEFHAHATSQIVSAVIDDRPLLQVWPDRVEYLWIIPLGYRCHRADSMDRLTLKVFAHFGPDQLWSI